MTPNKDPNFLLPDTFHEIPNKIVGVDYLSSISHISWAQKDSLVSTSFLYLFFES